MLGRLTWLWTRNSVIPDAQDDTSDAKTLGTIRDFLAGLSDLSAAVQGIEVYWSKRLHCVEQFGEPLVATWAQVEVFTPDWIQLFVSVNLFSTTFSAKPTILPVWMTPFGCNLVFYLFHCVSGIMLTALTSLF